MFLKHFPIDCILGWGTWSQLQNFWLSAPLTHNSFDLHTSKTQSSTGRVDLRKLTQALGPSALSSSFSVATWRFLGTDLLAKTKVGFVQKFCGYALNDRLRHLKTSDFWRSVLNPL